MMPNNLCPQYGLATPTDWNKECDLLKEYLASDIQSEILNIEMPNFPKSPADIIRLFDEQGLIYINTIAESNKLSFEEWKESKGVKSGTNSTEEFRFCNHHHELTDDHELVDFGTGLFVANKAAVPLLKALHEVGLKTRTHHFDGGEHGFISILLDNVDIEIITVNEAHADRTKFNGKKELLLRWENKKDFYLTDIRPRLNYTTHA